MEPIRISKRAIEQFREQYDRGDDVIVTDNFVCTREFFDNLPAILNRK